MMGKNPVLNVVLLIVSICQTNAHGSEEVQAHQRQQMVETPVVFFDENLTDDVLSILQEAEKIEEEHEKTAGSHSSAPPQDEVIMITLGKPLNDESSQNEEEELEVLAYAVEENDPNVMDYVAFIPPDDTDVIDQDFEAEEQEQEQKPNAKVYLKHILTDDGSTGSPTFNYGVLHERRKTLENELHEFETSFMLCVGSTVLLAVMLLFARTRQRRRAENERRLLTPDAIADIEIIDSYRYESNYALM